jgi:hypothetical protein
MSMKKSNDTTGNRTRDLPASSAVSQTPRTPTYFITPYKLCAVEQIFQKTIYLVEHLWQKRYISDS